MPISILSETMSRERISPQMRRLFLTLALCAASTMAQQPTGRVRGRILDELGGAIVGASVVAVDRNNKERTTTTNDQGLFSINDLTPGKYKIRASASGFAVYENPEVEIVAGQSRQIDIV